MKLKNRLSNFSFSSFISLLVAIVSGIFILFMIIILASVNQKSTLSEWAVEFPGSWTAILEDGTRKDITMPANLHLSHIQDVTFETTLPSRIPDGAVIYFATGKHFDAYIGDKLVATMPAKAFSLNGDPVKSINYHIRLQASDAGKTFRIVQNDTNVINGTMSKIYYGDSFGIWRMFFRKNGLKFCATLVLFIFSLACIFVGILTYSKYRTGKPLVVLCIGICAASLWSLFDSILFQYIFGIYYYDGIFSFITIMLTPYPFLYFINAQQHNRYQRLHAWLGIALLTNLVVACILHFTETVDFLTAMPFIDAIIGIVILLALGTVFWDWHKGLAKDYKYFAIGLLVLISLGIVEIIQINTLSWEFLDTFFIICGLYVLLVFALVQLFNQSNAVKSQMEDVLKASSLKSNFLANMSHEIRTPINAIIGLDDMILKEKINDNVREYAVNIQSASTNLVSIINEILDFSKIESGNMSLVIAPYSLSDVLLDVVNIIDVQATSKGLKFNLDISSTLPDSLSGDSTKLRQIMINLLNNSTKYTEEGSIDFSVSGKREGSSILLTFTVKDTGIGISQDDLPNLFQKFRRFDERRNQSIEGTGLGLSITGHFVNMMGGTITVDSALGKGTTFTVTLRQDILVDDTIKSFEEQRKARSINITNDSSNTYTAPDAKILVVDDNQMNITVAVGLLKPLKAQVDTCTSGQMMLNKITQQHYDVILLDHMMPYMDGIEALRLSKEMLNNQCKDTPIIAMTANAISGMRERYLSVGFDDYISKPVRGKELEALIRRHLPAKLIVESDVSDEPETIKCSINAPDEFDFKYALSLLGDERMLLDTLSDFVNFLSTLPDALNSDFENFPSPDSLKNYQIKIHSLKSNAATVGALMLSKMARLIEIALQEQNIARVSLLHPVICEEISKHQSRILPLLDNQTKNTPLIDAPDNLHEILASLLECLLQFDYDSAESICDSLGTYRYAESIANDMKALLRDVSEYEREESIGLIKIILMKL